jgi:hypothetical protein
MHRLYDRDGLAATRRTGHTKVGRQDPGGPAGQDRGKRMTQNIPPGATDRAQALFGDLIEGRWEEARREFDVRLNGHAVDRLASGWREMADSAGSFKRVGAPVARQSGDYTVVDVPLTAGRGEAIGKVVINTDGKVAGLALEYPRRHRLDPRRVRTLFLGNPEVLGLRRTRT